LPWVVLVVAYLTLVAVLVVILLLPTRMPRFLSRWLAKPRAWLSDGPLPRATRSALSRLRRRGQKSAQAPTPEQSREVDVVLYTLELGRLATEIEKVRQSDRPGKMVHMTATVAAYDTVLLTCCRTVGLTVPDRRPPLAADERLEAELALLARGVEW